MRIDLPEAVMILFGLVFVLLPLKRLCSDDPEAPDAIDRAMQGRQGERTDLLDNIQEVAPAPTGTSRQAAIRRLRKDRPDLHAKVLKGEVSAHRAPDFTQAPA